VRDKIWVFNMKTRILVVEDDGNLAMLLRENLAFEGFEVDVVSDGALALGRANEFLPHLVVLDLMLPGVNGFELCSALRRNGRTPILIVSARTQKRDKIRGLNLGADDYLAKPFDLEEFLARVHAVLRRVLPTTDQLVLGSLTIDFRSHLAYRGTQEVNLTHREFEILKYLAERPGRAVGRDELLRNLWEYAEPGITRSVDHAIARLRRKIELEPQQPRFIHTAVGYGYLLTPEGRPFQSTQDPSAVGELA
jgi:DNA-binding response OmpR family regulator